MPSIDDRGVGPCNHDFRDGERCWYCGEPKDPAKKSGALAVLEAFAAAAGASELPGQDFAARLAREQAEIRAAMERKAGQK